MVLIYFWQLCPFQIKIVVIKHSNIFEFAPISRFHVIEHSFQSKVTRDLQDIKKMCKESDLKRVEYEARMQTQWDVFVKKMLLMQGQVHNGHDESHNDDDDFHDLDDKFPITHVPYVEELEWSLQKDLVLKRRLVNINLLQSPFSIVFRNRWFVYLSFSFSIILKAKPTG